MNHLQVRRLDNHCRWLDQRLNEVLRRPNPDAQEIQELRRQKLQVRDELFLAKAGLQSARGGRRDLYAMATA